MNHLESFLHELEAGERLESRSRHPSGRNRRILTLGDGSQIRITTGDGITLVYRRDHTDAPWSGPVELEEE